MPKITEMFAFIIADEGPDDEGVAAYLTGGLWMPMVGADMDRIKSLEPIARNIARSLKKPVRLVKFLQMEELEVFI